MMTEAERDEFEGLDELDRARASDMDDRPIYHVTIDITVQVIQEAHEQEGDTKQNGEVALARPRRNTIGERSHER